MKAREIKLPNNLLISKYALQADYTDSFGILLVPNKNSVQDYTHQFFTLWPKWVHFLFRLRNFIVKPFGLQASKEEMSELTNPKFDFRKGGSVAFFNISEITDNEILVFANDKHLNTWLSMCIIVKGEQRELLAITAVKYNNFLGRSYFFFIKPFHKLIVKKQLNRMNLSENSE